MYGVEVRRRRFSQSLLADTQALVRNFEGCRSREDIDTVIRTASAAMGVTSHVVGIVPNGIVHPRDQPGYVLAGTWPEEWARRYFARQYVQTDPAIEYARSQTEPSRWDRIRSSKTGARILDEAGDFGLRQGLTIPQFTLDGIKIGVSFSGDRLDDAPDASTALVFLAAIAANRGIALAQESASVPTIKLTRRERECLLWLVEGKSDWEISVILGISRRAVERYMANLRQKLGASTRVQAVVTAFRTGLIS